MPGPATRFSRFCFVSLAFLLLVAVDVARAQDEKKREARAVVGYHQAGALELGRQWRTLNQRSR